MQLLGSHWNKKNLLSLYFEYQHPEMLFGSCGFSIGDEETVLLRDSSTADPPNKEGIVEREILEASHV